VNLLKSPLRRTTAVLAGAVIGLAGVVATAAPASAHHPELTGTAACVEEGGWKVDWTLTAVAPHEKVGTIVKVESTEGGSPLSKIVVDATVGANQTVTETQSFPVEVTKAKLVVAMKWDGVDRKRIEHKVEAPEGCKPPTEPEEPPAEEPAQPTPILEVTCDTMTIGLDNTTDEDITLLLTTSKGEERTLEIPAGEKGTEKFSADKGFSVTVGLEGTDETEKVDYVQPEGCEGTGGGSGEPELPETGAAVGGIAGGAGLLLVVGAGLFFLARRRKVKFTA
jgi:LPXTG-motif cell wall-anchored protein